MGYWIFQEDEHKRKLEGRYWNPSTETHPNLNIAIIASITLKPKTNDFPAEGFDWAAYIGAAPEANTEEAALKVVSKYGAKLSETDARYFFPDIELPYRK